MSACSHTGSPAPRRGSQWLWASALCLLALFVPRTAQALEPEELAIIAMQASPESLDVARYYAAARKVPTEQICEIARVQLGGDPERTAATAAAAAEGGQTERVTSGPCTGRHCRASVRECHLLIAHVRAIDQRSTLRYLTFTITP